MAKTEITSVMKNIRASFFHCSAAEDNAGSCRKPVEISRDFLNTQKIANSSTN